ncbi:MAG: hypothetical protein A2X83_05025 [Desulfuromonadales bacterium GWD2_54_10]|nr:MAG: hypothetical protein A2X83_05025 [Desulfuromonadales bacterium GWD2_54_10]
MRGGTHLKAVRDIGETGTKPMTTTEKRPETYGSWLETTRLPALLNDMERMMNEFFHRPLLGLGAEPFRNLMGELETRAGMFPTVDVFEDGGTIVVKADLPGLTRKDIEVKLIDNNLEITGEKKTEEKIERKDYMKVERSSGKFNRVLRLPEGLDAEHVTANFNDGVLEVRIPRKEGKRAIHHITIK